MTNQDEIKLFSEMIKNIFAQIERDIVGQQEVIEGTIIAMVAGGKSDEEENMDDSARSVHDRVTHGRMRQKYGEGQC